MPWNDHEDHADEQSGLDELKDKAHGERLQRVMADAGVGSRRTCEELIEQGRVQVNGRTVTELPLWVNPHEDRVEVDGRPIPPPERMVYVLLNKPTRTLSTAEDEPGSQRRTVLDIVDHPAKARLFPVGRLDYDTVGLLLLTNDGELANRLTHPRYGVPKTYRAVVKGRLEEEEVEQLEEGIYLAERKAGQTVGARRTSRVELLVHSYQTDKTVLEITLREGRNRQVRRMMAAVGHPVKRLERVGMGPLKLKGVARGLWRELDNREVNALKRAAAAAEREEHGDGSASPKPARARGPRTVRPATPGPKGPRSRSGPASRSAPGGAPRSGPGSRGQARPEQSRPGQPRPGGKKPGARPGPARPRREDADFGPGADRGIRKGPGRGPRPGRPESPRSNPFPGPQRGQPGRDRRSQ